jgi:hypothetical protein
LIDAEAVLESSQWVWEAGPQPTRAQDLDFKSAQRDFSRSSRSSAGGTNQEALVCLSANRMAAHMRRLAHDGHAVGPGRKELPIAVGQRIDTLAKKYARFIVTPEPDDEASGTAF